MKLSKKLVAVLLLVVMVFSLAACGSNSIVGVWKMDVGSLLQQVGMSESEYEAMKSLLGDMEGTVEFTSDGKMITKVTAMGQTQTQEGTYTVEGDKLTMDGSTGTYKIDGNKLTLTQNGMSMTLTRK